MIILDTDHISILQHEDSPKAVALVGKLASLPEDEVATTQAGQLGGRPERQLADVKQSAGQLKEHFPLGHTRGLHHLIRQV